MANTPEDKIEIAPSPSPPHPPASKPATASPSLDSPAPSYDRRDATETEIKTLRHVRDSIPRTAWIALAVGAAERFAFYAITAPWQNYMQNTANNAAVPGALGLGQATATNIYNAFYFFSFITPVPFAVISDVWLGRLKTLYVGFVLYLCGCIILFITSLPTVLERGGGI